METSYIADLHVHISLKPANNQDIRSIWDEDTNPKPKEFYPFVNVFRNIVLGNATRNFATYTQSNLRRCIDGKVKVVFCTIYPIERQYIDRQNLASKAISKLFVITTNFPFIALLNRHKYFITSLIQMLLGASKSRSVALWDEQKDRDKKSIDYFQDYQHELRYLVEAEKISPPADLNDYSFKLVRNYDELKVRLQDTKKLSGIANLEGINGLGTYRFKDLFGTWKPKKDQFDKVVNAIIKNLEHIKQDTRYRLFYITPAHHFNNLLYGQSKSFRGAFSQILKQNISLRKGMKEAGMDLIKNHILSRQNGYRILVDVKHLSVSSRRAFYSYVESQRQLGDHIPIISSHSAVNGLQSMDDAQRLNLDGKKNKNSYVSQWSVNLSDEDILQIYRSDGIIGILMHDGRMPGGKFKKELKRVRKFQAQKNLLHQQMFMTNIYHIIRVIHETGGNGWNTVCLGSDMDGIVDPFDNYSTADRLLAFRNHLYLYLNDYDSRTTKNHYPIVDLRDHSKFLSPDMIKELNQGQTTKQIIDRIFCNNSDLFLSKYFTEDYLTGNAVT